MKLSEDSLNWAREHLTRFPDAEFFVKPFELNSLWGNWSEVLSVLSEYEITDLNVKTPLTFSVPKPSGNFRIVHQLDPIDSLIYTALVYEVAEHIEAARIPEKKKVACSYRIDLSEPGNFFSKTLSENCHVIEDVSTSELNKS